MPPEWLRKLLDDVWELEAQTTGGGVNTAAMIGLVLIIMSGALLRLLTTCFDRLLWFIERWREWKSFQMHNLPYVAKEVPYPDSRFKLGTLFVALAISCVISLAVMNT